jgi:hypothetical protein
MVKTMMFTKRILFRFAQAVGMVIFFAGAGNAQTADLQAFPGANRTPKALAGWEQSLTKADPSAPKDEAQGGQTELGTPVMRRTVECFPPEPRNLFWQVDQVATPNGTPRPLNYLDPKGNISEAARNAIRGQNTWMLWGEGNEVMWNWLQQNGYGLVDFLIILDSRKRSERFKDAGFINQPGMEQADKNSELYRLLGLYLDKAGKDIALKPPDWDKAERPDPNERHQHASLQLFKPGDDLYEKVLNALPTDGVDTTIYGYPSGIVGLRLMPNPDFFGTGDAAKKAREYWNQRVVRGVSPAKEADPYYTNADVYADPKLVRPFRPSMSCAFCHVGPHPLNPPQDPEKPEWKNLSSTIGNQYWSPKVAFANLTKADNFLHHFLASQQPGTIDTSLVSTDNINNANTIISLFDFPARLERAKNNHPESQSRANLLLPNLSKEEEQKNGNATPRYIPRILLGGEDSIGPFGALMRVPVNIGTYWQEWRRDQNPVIGYKPQRPFSIATSEANSVYWRTTEQFRIPDLLAFFTYETDARNSSTAPMKVVDAVAPPEVKDQIKKDLLLAPQGRRVFLTNCAICHSSKQPQDFQLEFSRDWKSQDALAGRNPANLVLPMDFAEWEEFKKTGAYKDYVQRISDLAQQPVGDADPFLTDNFLSNEIRIPVTLVGTNSGRAVGTNSMRGQIWDNFSSEDYKNLPPVGPVRFYNPYSGVPKDERGCNDAYFPPGGGPGYYRPASLISLWATGPYLHNNTLGLYNHDPSVKGRLEAFRDGITKLLWYSKRTETAIPAMGDLRSIHHDLTKGDPGFIYRTTEVTWITIPQKFINQLLSGLLGSFWTSFLTLYLWLLGAVLLTLLAWLGRPRHAGLVFTLFAVVAGVAITITRFDKVYWELWLLPAFGVVAAFLVWFGRKRALVARIGLGILGLLSLGIGIDASLFVNGDLGPLMVGPIPQGTPVNLIMNVNPDAPMGVLAEGYVALLRGSLLVRKNYLKGERALSVFEKEAGLPLLRASKCPDFVLDRGHWFAEALTDDEKKQLMAFLETL